MYPCSVCSLFFLCSFHFLFHWGILFLRAIGLNSSYVPASSAKWTGASPLTTKYGICNIQATRSFFISLYRIFVQCCLFHCLFFLSLRHHVQQIAVKPCFVRPRANSLLQNGRAQAQSLQNAELGTSISFLSCPLISSFGSVPLFFCTLRDPSACHFILFRLTWSYHILCPFCILLYYLYLFYFFNSISFFFLSFSSRKSCLEQDHGRSCGFIILSISNSLQNGVVDFEGHLWDPNSSNCSIPSLHYKIIFKFSATPQKNMLKTGLYFGRLQLQNS